MPAHLPPLLTLDIDGLDLSADGAGFGRVNGTRIVVDYVLPGERVEVRPVAGGGDELRADLVRVIRKSPHRVAPECRFFGPCGSCAWQHVSYAEQLRLKRAFLRQLLSAGKGGKAVRVEPVLPTPPASDREAGAAAPWGFRNKVSFVFGPASRNGGLVMGHYRRHSRSIVAVEECPVHDEAGNRVAYATRDALARAGVAGATADAAHGVARHIVVRATLDPRETLATLVATRNARELRPAVRAVLDGPSAPAGFHLNLHDRPGPYMFGRQTIRLSGRQRVRETVRGTRFLISPTAFFQTNVAAAREMVRVVTEQARGARRALDLYAGAGLFALALAAAGVRVTAVEENPEAVEDGEASRTLSRIPERDCRFVCSRAEDFRVRGGREHQAADLVVLDPPRTGCPPAVLDWVCRSIVPRRIVYVSCNPSALARDLQVPAMKGYAPVLVQPIDMFPHTAHIETIAVLDQRNRRGRPAADESRSGDFAGATTWPGEAGRLGAGRPKA